MKMPPLVEERPPLHRDLRRGAWRRRRVPTKPEPAPQPAAVPGSGAGHERERGILLCLTPVRNAAADVKSFLDSIEPLADAVIVLDDGSDDGTRELLERDRRVTRLLVNPLRSSFAEWDDSANRQALLDAAGELNPDWVLFLDADERVDPDDAAALRAFVDGDALPGCAYGLQLFRAWGEAQCEPAPTYVFRLFAHRPGLRLPEDRLHLNPVPVSIPQSLWIKTSIRVRHLDSEARIQQRRRKYAEADSEGVWERGPGPQLEAPTTLVPWRARDPGLAVLVSGADLERATIARPERERQSLACLLPVRNAEHQLEGFLESAGRFADAVLALDDGSTDRSAELLADHALVELVASNPVRETYAGWDDAANRQTLLDIAIGRGFDWVMYLDADERIDAEDSEALRRFVEQEASPADVYGFRRFRMIGDGTTYDRAGLWVYRLFAPGAGDELPTDLLHFIPVPESREPSRWRRTTIRIQHLADLTAELRRDRYRKYEEVDPDRQWQPSYDNLLEEEGEARPWPRRPPGFPALADPRGRGLGAELDLTSLDLDAPVVSVICIAQRDAATIEQSVAAIVGQECDFPFETIVVTSGGDATGDIVRSRFPGVRVIELTGEVLPGAARNAGLAVAGGDYVTFPGSHVILEPGSLAARVRAHERGHPMVSGPVLNATDTPAGWASYFMEHATSLPGRPSGPLHQPPVRCSYPRDILVEIGGFPEDCRAGEDTAVNNELWARGLSGYFDADVRIVHRTPCRAPSDLIRHHHERGVALGRILTGGLGWHGSFRRRHQLLFTLLYVPRRLRVIHRGVRLWGGSLRSRYGLRVRALVIAGVLAAWLGLLAGLSRRVPNPD